jgi:hypothetical protein
MNLITSTQAAEIAGITPSTFRTLAHKHTTKTPVPQPAATAGSLTHPVHLYDRAEIEAWAATRNRKRGANPHKQS